MTVLTKERRFVLKGYFSMLSTATGNGAFIHKVKQYQTVIKAKLHLSLDITPEYEEEIKVLIRKLYSNDLKDRDGLL